MKKILVALAATAATGAFAADSVTLYGVADAWLGQQRVASSTASQLKIQSGGLSTSRVGINVKEDLGDDLKGFVVLEAGANIDDPAGSVVARKSIVGVSGSFGSVGLGYQTTPYDDFYSKSFLTMDSAFDGMKLATNKTHRYSARFANSVRYDTPNFDGFSAGIHLGLGEDKGTTSAQKDASFGVRYANGPIVIGLAHQKDEAKANVNAAITSVTNTVIAGSYDFGALKLNAGMNNSKQSGSNLKEKTWNVGVAAPVGPVTLLAQVGRAKLDGAQPFNTYGVEARYGLSKRTTVYGGVGQSKQKNGNPDRNIGIGVRHTF